MKSFLCFLAILLSAHYLLAETPGQSDDGAQNNRRGDYSNIATCSKGIDEGGEGDFVPVLSNVTVSQYCAFLNAVAADDSHHLYDKQMGSDSSTACITRSGTPGNYTYSVIEGRGEDPIAFVSWFDQARFCNWIENGQPIGLQGPRTTEEGTYILNNDEVVSVNSKANHFLSSQLLCLENGSVSNSYLLSPNYQISFQADFAPQMQMNPAEEEAVASCKNVIFGATTSPELNKITLTPIQQEHINCGLGKLTTRDDLKKSSNYASANALWDQRHEGWKNHLEIHRTLQQKLQEQTFAQEREREAIEADEHRDENQLGQFKQRLEQLATILQYVPLPPTQVAATAVDTAASALHWINTIWTKTDLVQAKVAKVQAEKAHHQAKTEAEQATMAIVNLEQQARQHEEEALAQEHTNKLAESLRPRVGWGEYEWEKWSDLLLTKTGSNASVQELQDQEQTKLILAQQGPLNLNWVTEQTSTAWRERFKKSKEQHQLLTQESKKNVAPLQRAYDQADKVVKKKIEATESALSFLQVAQRREKELKKSIEAFLKNHVQGAEGEEWNQQKINKNRQEFCDNFGNLIKNHFDIEASQNKWKAALQQEHEERLQTLRISQELEAKKEEYQRLLHRAQVRHQADQEQLRKVWPEYDLTFRPYLQWELPFIEEIDVIKGVSGNDASIRGEHLKSTESVEIEPPLELQEEREARGHRYLYQAKKEREQEFNLLSLAQTTTIPKQNKEEDSFSEDRVDVSNSIETSPSSALASETTTPRETETFSFSDILLTPHDDIFAWSLEQVDRPGIAEQQRWAARRQLDLYREETKKIAQALQQESQKEDQTETGTVISWMTGKSKAQKTPTRISGFTTGTRSTITTMERPSSGTTNLQEQFQQALRVEKKAEERWLELMKQAENVRVGDSFESPEVAMEAWAHADRKAAEEQQRRKDLLQEKRAAEAMERSWKENNERWRARTQADLAKKRVDDLKKDQIDLSLRKGLTEAVHHKEENALHLKLNQANEDLHKADAAWLKLAQKQKSILKAQQDGDWDAPESAEEQEKRAQRVAIALEKLRDFDRAVLQRWNQFEENEGPQDPQKALALQYPVSYSLELGMKLEETEKAAFEKAPWVEQGIKKYQQMATQEALRAARENMPESTKAWEERVHRGTQQLQEWERQIADPNTPRNNAADFRDHLPQLRGVVVADQKAQVTFEKEKHRLDKIEGLWKNIKIAQQEAQFQKAQEAAHYYHQGDSTSWNNLTDEERQEYNNQIAEKNRIYDEELYSEEAFLDDIKKQLNLEQAKATRFLLRAVGAITGQQEAALAFLKQAQDYYDQRYHDLTQHQKALRWAGLTTFEKRKNELLLEEKEQALKEEEQALEKLKVQVGKMYSPQSLSDAAMIAPVILPVLLPVMMPVNIVRTVIRKIRNGCSWQQMMNYTQKETTGWVLRRTALNESSHAFKKFTAATAAGQSEVSELWKKVAMQYQLVAEYYQKSAEAYSVDKLYEGAHWQSAGLEFNSAAETLKKMIEAKTENKEEIVLKYREIAEQYACAGEYYAKNVAEGDGCNYEAGQGFDKAAKRLEEAIDAEAEGKSEIAFKYRENAKQYTRVGEYYAKAAAVHAVGKPEEATSWENAAKALDQAAAKLEQSISEEKNKLAFHIDQEACDKPRSLKYRELVEQQERSVDSYIKAAAAYAAGKPEEGACWNGAGDGLYSAAEKLKQTIDGEIFTPETALKYREAAEQQMRSVESYIKAAAAYAAGKSEEGACWKSAGYCLYNTGDGLYNEAEKLQQAVNAEAKGEPEIALKYREIAEHYVKAVAAYTTGKSEEGDRWKKAGDSLDKVAKALESAIFYEGEYMKQPERALEHRKAAERFACSAEYYVKAASAHAKGKSEEGACWNNAGDALDKSTRTLEEAIYSEKHHKPEIALKYREAAEQQIHSVEHFAKAAAAYAAGNVAEGDRLKAEAESIFKEAKEVVRKAEHNIR